MINFDLSNHCALVCGASKGMGQATAHQFAELGCTIVALSRSENDLKNTISNLPVPKKQEHQYIAVDLLKLEELDSKISSLITNNKIIDILINNAGGPKPGAISAATPQDFNNAFTIHLQASAFLSRKLLPGMINKNFGRIINIISTSVKCPIDNLGVSNTARWAVAAWAKTLSKEVAQHNITVNSILPGFVDTDRFKNIVDHNAKNSNTDPEILRQELIDSIPAKRIASPSEIAQVIAFIASPAASYINGVALPVDGGRTPSL